MTSYYKVLTEDGSAIHGTGKWMPGEWRSVDGELVPCRNGLHLCRREDLVSWLGPTIWTAEADESEILVNGDNVVVRRARIVARLDAWTERTARLFAADCAGRVLEVYEAENPHDPHPRQAIETARRYAKGQASREELEAVYEVAYSAAAYEVAYSAESWELSAPGSAAYWAYWAAYQAANSVNLAVYSARYSARYSAYAAAEAAADSVAEREWQTERLFAYLDGGA